MVEGETRSAFLRTMGFNRRARAPNLKCERGRIKLNILKLYVTYLGFCDFSCSIGQLSKVLHFRKGSGYLTAQDLFL